MKEQTFEDILYMIKRSCDKTFYKAQITMIKTGDCKMRHKYLHRADATERRKGR